MQILNLLNYSRYSLSCKIQGYQQNAHKKFTITVPKIQSKHKKKYQFLGRLLSCFVRAFNCPPLKCKLNSFLCLVVLVEY